MTNKIAVQGEHRGNIIGPHNNIYLIDCKYCNFIHQYPLVNVEKYYSDDNFYSEHSPRDWFDKERHEHDKGLWNPYYRFKSNLLNSTSLLIDIGCGSGRFMEYWNNTNTLSMSLGVEPSRRAHNNAPEDLFIFKSKSDLEQVFYRMFNNFNANIHLALVLEHIHNPIDFLASYIPLMGEEGNVMIVVPNDFSVLQNHLGTHHFISPVHVNYFNDTSLYTTIRRAFHKAEYEYVPYSAKYYATFPMELFEVIGYHYIGDETRGRRLHNFRLYFEKMLGTLAFGIYTLLYKKYGWGREIIFVAEGKRM